MAAEGLYPLSTQSGQAVPLEIVKPLSLVQWAMAANVSQDIVIPAGKCAWVYSTVDAILSLGAGALPNALVAGTVYPNAIFIPSGSLITLEITPGVAKLLGLQAGKFYMNVAVQWAALVQASQTSIG